MASLNSLRHTEAHGLDPSPVRLAEACGTSAYEELCSVSLSSLLQYYTQTRDALDIEHVVYAVVFGL